MNERNSIAFQLAQNQLEAYNTKNIDRFLENYADHVKAYDLTSGTLKFEGLTEMRGIYEELFRKNEFLHCRLVNRIVVGNIVIDEELVTRSSSPNAIHVVAIYEVKDRLICKIWFSKG